jgi:hypothetical protein
MLHRAWQQFLDIPRKILRTPIKVYRSVVVVRNWVLAKIEFLQTESQKWKTAFTIVKTPYTVLRAFGLSPQMATSLLVAGSVAGGGVVVNEITSERSFARGDSGTYLAPLDVPVSYVEGDNTLKIELGSTPVGEILLTDLTLGTAYANSALPQNESSVIIVGGMPTVADPAFTETYLEVGEMTIDRWRCTQLKLDNIEVYNLNLKWNRSDGQSVGAVASATPINRAVGGGNRANNMTSAGGYYDQLKIIASTSGVSGRVDKLTMSNIYTKGGPCVLSRIKAGTLNIFFMVTGAGDGLAAKDLIISDSVLYRNFSNIENVEELISPP